MPTMYVSLRMRTYVRISDEEGVYFLNLRLDYGSPIRSLVLSLVSRDNVDFSDVVFRRLRKAVQSSFSIRRSLKFVTVRPYLNGVV